MVPDAMNLLGVVGMVLLACFCVILTFRAWWDSRANDLKSLKEHLRLIGVSQIVIILTSIAICADMVVSCRVAIEKASQGDMQTVGYREYRSNPVYRASQR
jgi:hypothetical protein